MVKICVMMNSKNYAEKLGKMNTLIYLSTDLRKRINGEIVFVTKTKTSTLNAPLKQNLLNKQNIKYI